MKTLFTSLILLVAMNAFTAPPEPPPGFKWEVNSDYSDEFNGYKLDHKKWYNYHPRWEGRAPARFMPHNVSVRNGYLRLNNNILKTPIHSRRSTFTIGGAAVVSKKTSAHFGYYECRLKASSTSMSSTFWFSGPARYFPGIGKVSQELDVLETIGKPKNNPSFATHMNSNTHVWHSGKSRSAGNKAPLPTSSDQAFYTYGAWWVDANTVHFYLNDKPVGTVQFDTSLLEAPFQYPMHLNMVTETYDWEKPPTAEELEGENTVTLIDWVRAYTLESVPGK